MATSIFLNLPVNDLSASRAFFTRLGFTFNEQFSNESGAAMVVSDTIYVMLLAKPFFQSFTTKQIVDACTSAEVFICLSAESRAEVDRLADAGLAAGARSPRPCSRTGLHVLPQFPGPRRAPLGGDVHGHECRAPGAARRGSAS